MSSCVGLEDPLRVMRRNALAIVPYFNPHAILDLTAQDPSVGPSVPFEIGEEIAEDLAYPNRIRLGIAGRGTCTAEVEPKAFDCGCNLAAEVHVGRRDRHIPHLGPRSREQILDDEGHFVSLG